MMISYAVIRTGGKQYRVSEGDLLTVEKLAEEKGKRVEFSDVLLAVDGDKVLIGQPLVDQVRVEGEIVDHFQKAKVRVAKFKSKSRYRRVKGHRQELTKIEIKKIKTGESNQREPKKSQKAKSRAVD